MSLKMTGVVEQVGSKDVTTRFGNKPTYSFKVNGEWYKLGFKKAPAVVEGANVSFDYTPGKYGNEVDPMSVMPSTAAPTAPAAGVAGVPRSTGGGRNGVFPIPAEDGQRSIVRQNALTNAREFYCARSGGKGGTYLDKYEMDANAIIGLARIFESYTTGDRDLEEVMAELKKD